MDRDTEPCREALIVSQKTADSIHHDLVMEKNRASMYERVSLDDIHVGKGSGVPLPSVWRLTLFSLRTCVCGWLFL